MNILRNGWLLAIVVCIGSFKAVVAQEATHRFTLEQALEYASEHGYTNISSNYDVEAAQRKIWETVASGLPQVDFSGRYNHSIDLLPSLFPLKYVPEADWPEGLTAEDKIPVTFGSAYDATYTLGVTQMIFDGSYFVGVQATRVFVELTEQTRRKTEIELRSQVAQSYFLVLSAQENKGAFEELLQNNEAILRETKAMHETGFVEALDVSQMELLVNDTRKRMKEVERNEMVAMAVLKYALGMKGEDQLELADSLSHLSQRMLGSGLPQPVLDQEKHVDFQLAAVNEESQKLMLRNEQVQYLPKINAFYNYQKMGYSDEWNVFGEEWYKAQFVGVQVSIPIFSSGMRHAKVQQQKLNWLKSQNEKERTMHELDNNFYTAMADMKNSHEQYLYSIQNRELALDILDKTRTKFSHGVSTSSEFTQQQGQYIQAQLNYVQSAVNLMNAHIALLKATGEL
jgi:outer membrane protein TolC